MDAARAPTARTATTNRGNVGSPSRSLEHRRRSVATRRVSGDRRSARPRQRSAASSTTCGRACTGSDAQRDQPASPPAKVKPVLVIVDDEPDVLRSVQDLLRMDYQVHTFQHGAEALEFLRDDPARARDSLRPADAGDERRRGPASRRWRFAPRRRGLLFTAYTDIRAVVDAINQGNVFRYLAKPCDPDVPCRRRAAGGRASRPDRRKEHAAGRAPGDPTPGSWRPTGSKGRSSKSPATSSTRRSRSCWE